MRGLGGIEAARQRFLLAEQRRRQRLSDDVDMNAALPPVPLDALAHEGFGPGGVISHGPRPASGRKAKKGTAAARGGGVVVMSEIVQVNCMYESRRVISQQIFTIRTSLLRMPRLLSRVSSRTQFSCVNQAVHCLHRCTLCE